MQDAEGQGFGETDLPPRRLLSRLRERLGEGPLAPRWKRRAKPGKRPSRREGPLPASPASGRGADKEQAKEG